MATPFPFVSGAVLTAAQLNSISELPTRTLTGSGAAVAADSYSRVILNGTSITYTINTSTFTAGQVVELYNANSTAATIAAGAGVTLNGAAALTLAQYQTGQLYAVSATSFILSKSDVTAASPALVVVKAETAFSGATSVTADNVFTSTYTNYLVVVRCTTSANATLFWALRTGGTTAATNYNYQELSVSSTTVAGARATAQTKCAYGASGTTMSLNAFILSGPNLAEATSAITYVNNQGASGGISIDSYVGNHTTATAYDGIELTGGTATGSYTIYGMSK